MPENPTKLNRGRLFGDSFLSIAGLVLMNATLQFALYPWFRNAMGDEGYGDLLFLLTLINVIAIPIGGGCNYARMKAEATCRVPNGDYHRFLLFAALAEVPYCLVVTAICVPDASPLFRLTFILLTWMMTLRYWGDVEYRIRLCYRQFFLYYLLIACGFVAGYQLYRLTNLWPLALLTGETLGVLYVYLFGKTLKTRPFATSAHPWRAALPILTLVGANAVSELIFNADRLLLHILIDGTAVTLFYIASLVGKTASLITTPLSGVLIGYLNRFGGRLTRRAMGLVTAISLALIVLGTGACILGSYILIPLLYPETFEMAKELIPLASLAQVIYFVTGLILVILIRYKSSRCQIVISALYAVCFLPIGIPMTLKLGIRGFTYALLITNAVRLLVSLAIGFFAKTETLPPRTEALPRSDGAEPTDV